MSPSPPARDQQVSAFLANSDQAMLLALRGAGQDSVIQLLWSYNRPVNIEQLRKFHRNLWEGILSRKIRHRRLPLGRHSWVTSRSSESNLHLAHDVLDAEQRNDWIAGQLSMPLDPEHGPAWRLSLQPFTDATTIVALTISHCIADGTAVAQAIREAVAFRGNSTPTSTLITHLAMVQPKLSEEIRQLLQDLWQARTAAAHLSGRLLAVLRNGWMVSRHRSTRHRAARLKHSIPVQNDTGRVQLTAVSVSIVASEWQEILERSGADDLSLVASLAVDIGRRLARINTGVATLFIPIQARPKGNFVDANAVKLARLQLHTDINIHNLREFRSRLKRALTQARRDPDFFGPLLPLVPLLPTSLFRCLYQRLFRLTQDQPISCSHMGRLSSQAMMIDGAPSDDFCFRGLDRMPTVKTMSQRGGLLTLLTAQIDTHFIVNVISHQIGQDNSLTRLQALVLNSLAEHGIGGRLFPNRTADGQPSP